MQTKEYKRKIHVSNYKAANKNQELFRRLDSIRDRIDSAQSGSVVKTLELERQSVVEQLVDFNQGLIGSQLRSLRKFCNSRYISAEDLWAEGRHGLMMCIEKFDKSKGVQFSTFASKYIWGYMLKYINSSPINPQSTFSSEQQGEKPASQQQPLCLDDYERSYEILEGEEDHGLGIVDYMFIVDLLRQVPSDERKIFWEIYSNSLSFAEIGRKYSMPCHVVRSKYKDAVERMKNLLFDSGLSKFSDSEFNIRNTYDVAELIQDRHPDSEYRTNSLSDYIFSILSHFPSGMLLSDLIDIINAHVGRNASARIRSIINSWLEGRDLPESYKLVTNIPSRRGRPRLQDEKKRKICLLQDKAKPPSWAHQ